MDNLPKVAIICANYNYSDYIIAAMESIVNQTYKGELRLYVVDDGSGQTLSGCLMLMTATTQLKSKS